jgi:YbbR domain-containing protein
VAEGYEEDRDAISLDHTTVTITGPRDTVEKIASAKILVDLTDKMTTFVGNYPLVLCGLDGSPIADVSFVSTNLSTVRAVVQVNRVKIVPVSFALDFTDSGLQEGMATTYSTVKTVTLIGDGEALDKVPDSLEFTIQLKKYSGTSTETIVPSLPDGVRCKEEIMVHITIPDMAYRVFTVSQFNFINTPAGMTVEVADTYEVKVWGPSMNLDQIPEDAVIATIDCSLISMASSYAPVKYSVEHFGYMHVVSDWDNVLIKVHPVEE